MNSRLLLALLLGLLVSGIAAADGSDRGLVWQLDGANNRIYLVGSIHLLREADYPLPAPLERAYADAESLVMELDMDDLDESVFAASLFAMGRAMDGQTLESLIGEQRFAQARVEAAELGIDLSLLMSVEPWLAAMTIEQMVMMDNGFDPRFGLEAHFTARAVEDSKAIVGLERAVDQLAILDQMAIETQAEMLMMTLDEAALFSSTLNALVSSWRSGDTGYFESEFIEPMRAFPAIYEALLVNRNAQWVPAIELLLDDDDDVMIVVGAAHLVGQHSLVELLTKRGYTLKRLD